MADNEEIIRTRSPGRNIKCRTCAHKLPPVVVMGEKVQRYNYGTCKAYENKPQAVLWDGADCELYKKE